MNITNFEQFKVIQKQLDNNKSDIFFIYFIDIHYLEYISDINQLICPHFTKLLSHTNILNARKVLRTPLADTWRHGIQVLKHNLITHERRT